QVSNLIIDCPQVVTLDLHPLLASGTEFTVLDATMTLAPAAGDGRQRLAIRPYPAELEENFQLKDGAVVHVRPILPEDEP
ncbi:acetate--CoA ligase family protein, partial [Klebsiella pneumoniae]|nr:acetate--CoA ligase family protein [Klebsiella pneumoniae]